MIEVINLTKEIDGRRILDDVSLTCEKGQLFAVLGPSGSGKTSLLRLIAGFDRPSRGEIRLDGLPASSPKCLLPPASRKISLIFQNLALWPHLSVWKNIEFVIDRRRLQSKKDVGERIEGLLAAMYLTPYRNRYPEELSGGEKQRLAIARALARDPEYLLMDEPFSNLDDLLREELLELTLSLKKESGMAILYVTHNIDEALLLADKILVLKEGRITRTWLKEEMKDLSRKEIIDRSFRVQK